MDITLERELKGKPAVRRMLASQCQGDWERVIMTSPGNFRVFNTAAQATAARERLRFKERSQHKALMEQPPQPAKRAPSSPPAAPPLEVKRVTPPPARPRVARTATSAELQALGHLLQKQQDEKITPGTNVVHTVDREERARQAEERLAWSSVDESAPPFDWAQVDLGDSAARFRDRFAQGLPASVRFSYLPDVLALFMDFDLVEDALRHPERVEIRPETFSKGKGYPVLGFYRGDVCTILGLRDPTRPAIIAAYAGSLLEHDTHRPGHTGGGGSKKKDTGLPRNPKQLLNRLRAAGCQVADDGKSTTVPVLYKGTDLGKISVAPATPRATTESDWQRCQRKIAALDRRADAS